VLEILREDPFISRCYAKPRGYAGDAVMLDFIYHHSANLPYLNSATPRGRASTVFSTNSSAPRAVRNRAWLLAGESTLSAIGILKRKSCRWHVGTYVRHFTAGLCNRVHSGGSSHSIRMCKVFE
jgi:hypothetical protein